MEASPRILVPHELFAPAESSYFSGTYNLADLEAGPDVFTFKEPLEWNVTLTNTGGALLIAGVVKGCAKTSCARCLVDYAIPVKGEVQGFFLLSNEEKAPEDMDDDEFDVLGEDNIIDMVPLLNAALLIEFPLIPLCSNDCKGLCPHCGQDLNEGNCSCSKQADTTENVRPNPFAVLKDFSFDDTFDNGLKA